jgi:C-terminal processing protease CtpA/Prc
MQQPGKPHFGGKVFILINGGSFSTTCEFTSTVHFHKRATFIGEEAGGGYYGNTSGYGTTVTLPNSKLVLNLPFQTYYLSVNGYKAADRSVMPDYPIHYTIRELLAGEDKEMAVALKLSRE